MNDNKEPTLEVMMLLDGTFEIKMVFPIKKQASQIHKILTAQEIEDLQTGKIPYVTLTYEKDEERGIELIHIMDLEGI